MQDQDQAQQAARSCDGRSGNEQVSATGNYVFDDFTSDLLFGQLGTEFSSESALLDLDWVDQMAGNDGTMMFGGTQPWQLGHGPFCALPDLGHTAPTSMGSTPASSGRPVRRREPPVAPNSSSARTPASDTTTAVSSRKHSVSPLDRNGETSCKRQRNTEAARRYRQRKVDRVTELEDALAAMTRERDDYKIKLAKAETEVDVLRRMVGGRNV